MSLTNKLSWMVPMLALFASVAACGDDTGSGGSGATSNAGGAGGTGGVSTGGNGGTGGAGGNPALCGNGAIEPGEECDDAAKGACGDGCNDYCKVQSGYSCTGAPSVCAYAPADKADPAVRCTGAAGDFVVTPIMNPDDVVWADKVVAFSSEYSPTDYGSKQALGAPDFYPIADDSKKAWATLETDKAGEFITVGFTTPTIGSVVWIYETFNPDAVKKVTITAADGDHVVNVNATPKSIGSCAYVLTVQTKTCSPISAIRIDLASELVPTYNEIDAIGITP